MKVEIIETKVKPETVKKIQEDVAKLTLEATARQKELTELKEKVGKLEQKEKPV